MDNKISVDYLHTNNYAGVLEMPDDNRKRKGVPISLSEAQIEAMDKAAAKAGMNRSEFIRKLLADTIDNFPDDLSPHGSGLNKPRDL